MPHTTDDDDRRYRPQEELEAVRQLDPVVNFGASLIAQGMLSHDQAERIKAQALQEINDATDAAEAASPPDVSTLFHAVYSQ